MRFSKVFWSVFSVSYFVNAVFWVSVMAVRTFPPKDGNYAREFGGSLAICVLTMTIFWPFIPEACGKWSERSAEHSLKGGR